MNYIYLLEKNMELASALTGAAIRMGKVSTMVVKSLRQEEGCE